MSQQQHRINIIDAILKFLWPVGIFRDVSKGTLFERAAAFRHNREVRGCLPHYMNNCLMASALLYTAGVVLEHAHNLPAALLCWVLMIYTITDLVVLSAIYLVLTAWES